MTIDMLRIPGPSILPPAQQIFHHMELNRDPSKTTGD